MIFSQFFIDEKYQGKGYGFTAAKLVLEHMKKAGRFDKVVLCYIDGNDAAKNLVGDILKVSEGRWVIFLKNA
ncbi:MAG: GNAT family N-acetyltransferase [Butyrivibrio sp.]|nr:GNAT family N-acetyltransferase [Butyrivibrio sp.]